MKHEIKELTAQVIRENGTTRVRINNEDFYYAAFRSFRSAEENVSDFYGSGYKFFCIHSSGIMTALANRTIPYSEYGAVWTGNDEYEWENLKKQTDMFIKNAPNAYFAAMIDINTPDWMLEENPQMRDTWKYLVQEVSNPIWTQSAQRYIESYIKKLDELLPGRVFGVYILAGGTTEWYTRDFKDASLNPGRNHILSYGKPIPSLEELYKSDEGILRCFKDDENVLDYFKYCNKIIPEVICSFAAAVKKACGGRKTVGVFFGYVISEIIGIVSLNHNEPHIVFDCPDIDMIISPASYDLRKLKSSSGFRVPLDSLTLSGKLYVHEIDSTTHLSYDKFAKLHGVPDDCLENLEETAAYLRREIGMILAKGHGFWFFDMFGGYYHDKELLEEVKNLRELAESLMKENCSNVSEIAFFADCESNYYINPDSDYPMIQFQIDELNKCGMPWDCFLTSDLLKENFDFDKYKLYIFPDIFKFRDEIREKTELIRKKGKPILFLHAPGYISDGGFDTAQMERLTGIRLKKCGFENAIMELTVENSYGKTLDFTHKINEWRVNDPKQQRVKFNMPPLFEIDEKTEVWGKFRENGGTAFGIKERENGGFDAFCACAPIPAELINMLAERSGAFSYCDAGTVIYLNSKIMTVYSYEGGDIKIRIPQKSVLREYFTDEMYISEKDGVYINFKEKETKIFTLGEV